MTCRLERTVFEQEAAVADAGELGQKRGPQAAIWRPEHCGGGIQHLGQHAPAEDQLQSVVGLLAGEEHGVGIGRPEQRKLSVDKALFDKRQRLGAEPGETAQKRPRKREVELEIAV